MITDARVLQPEFIPWEVQHRDAEVNYLSSVLSPITEWNWIDPALLHGPSIEVDFQIELSLSPI
jgi:Cdc6-like AAA superfamily ATPase